MSHGRPLLKLLFIVKKRSGYWGSYYGETGTGLWNSARFVVDMLNANGIEAKVVQVDDNNAIDREVTLYRPTHVLIEAFWVVPEKFDVLMPRHPSVKWIVRDHSETPFLAGEGIGFAWTKEYLRRGIEIMCNSPHAQHDMRVIAKDMGVSLDLITYGPNFYPLDLCIKPAPRPQPLDAIHIGCFGAIRPLKNHVVQAIAALEFSQRIGRELRFHFNGSRIEGGAEPIRKSLEAILGDRLVSYPWMTHEEFVSIIGSMDLSLQMSFSETFNIVTADAVSMGVPVITSPDIDWLGDYAHADPASVADIVNAMSGAWWTAGPWRAMQQRRDLAESNRAATRYWRRRFIPNPGQQAINDVIFAWFSKQHGSPISWSAETWEFLERMLPRLTDRLEAI